MGPPFGKAVTVCLCLGVILVCSCDKHSPGELPEVQRDKTVAAAPEAGQPVAPAETGSSSVTPPAKPTPAEFFPTKPR